MQHTRVAHVTGSRPFDLMTKVLARHADNASLGRDLKEGCEYHLYLKAPDGREFHVHINFEYDIKKVESLSISEFPHAGTPHYFISRDYAWTSYDPTVNATKGIPEDILDTLAGATAYPRHHTFWGYRAQPDEPIKVITIWSIEDDEQHIGFIGPDFSQDAKAHAMFFSVFLHESLTVQDWPEDLWGVDPINNWAMLLEANKLVNLDHAIATSDPSVTWLTDYRTYPVMIWPELAGDGVPLAGRYFSLAKKSPSGVGVPSEEDFAQMERGDMNTVYAKRELRIMAMRTRLRRAGA